MKTEQTLRRKDGRIITKSQDGFIQKQWEIGTGIQKNGSSNLLKKIWLCVKIMVNLNRLQILLSSNIAFYSCWGPGCDLIHCNKSQSQKPSRKLKLSSNLRWWLN